MDSFAETAERWGKEDATCERRVCREKSEPKRKGGKGKKRSENENNGRTGQTLRHQPAGTAPLFQGKTLERAACTPTDPAGLAH